jgi:F-type H+-transporting ATPase subunit epsilon
MNPFRLVVQDMNKQWDSDTVLSFIARDGSGSFGIQAHHETFVTCLRPGLARFRCVDDGWHYLAQPGAVVLFSGNELHLSTTQFILSDDRDALVNQMEAEWRAAEQALRSTKRNITQIEQALARKLWEMSRRGIPL